MDQAKRAVAPARSPRAWRIGRAVVLAVSVLGVSQPVAAAPTTPFKYAVVDLFGGTGPDERHEDSNSTLATPASVTASAAPATSGTATTVYGTNGFAVQTIANSLGAGAASIWSEGVVVGGGTGTGVLTVSAQIVGSISGQADLTYALFASPAPFDAQAIIDYFANHDFDPLLPNSVRLLYTQIAGGCGTPSASAACGHGLLENIVGPVNLTLVRSDVPFAYGTQYYFASVFGGDVSDGGPGGNASFLSSATVGVTLPQNAVPTYLSGVPSNFYPQAVPEPGSWLLLGAGLAFLGVAVRRLRSRG